MIRNVHRYLLTTILLASLPTENYATTENGDIVKKLMPSHQNNIGMDTPIACNATALATAIIEANNANNSAGGGLVVVPKNCTITISTPATVDNALPDITGNVTVLGSGETSVISRDTGAPTFRLFNVVSGGKLSLRNLVIANGITPGVGGAIQNAGTLVLLNTRVTNNTAANGGGIATLIGASTTVYESTFVGNVTTSVGGGALINFGTMTVQSSYFSDNTAPINGGAINTQPNGVSTISASQFFNNTSGGLGGAFSNLGVLNIASSTISLNTGSSGGGIATGNTNVNLSGTNIVNNHPDNCSPLNTIPGCTD